MNVTVKLPDKLVRDARHRAVNKSQSLSSWLADLVRRELASPEAESDEPKTWIEALNTPGISDAFEEKEFPLTDRKGTKHRSFTFEPEED